MHEHMRVMVSNPEDIEQVLRDLRSASLPRADRGAPLVRATVLNLVAYAERQTLAEQMGHWMADLAEQHPARAVIMHPEPAPGAGDLQIWVEAHCHPTLAGHLVCYEEVQVAARGPVIERLPALVLSLLLRDLPVVLWWPGDLPVGTTLFDRLMASSDRLVADSASATRPTELLRRLVALGHAEHCQCMIRDLNWGRLTPWRELTAQFFDPPDSRPYLERLDHVRIELTSAPERPDMAQPYLLAAWLATRLGWMPGPVPWTEVPGGAQLNLRRGQEPVVVEIESMPDEEPGSQGLSCLELSAHTATGEAAFTIQRSEDGRRATVSTVLPGGERRQRVVPFPVLTPLDLMSEELSRSGHDAPFDEALRMAAFFSAQNSLARHSMVSM